MIEVHARTPEPFKRQEFYFYENDKKLQFDTISRLIKSHIVDYQDASYRNSLDVGHSYHNKIAKELNSYLSVLRGENVENSTKSPSKEFKPSHRKKIFTDEEVLEILGKFKSGVTKKELARQYKVSPKTIRNYLKPYDV